MSRESGILGGCVEEFGDALAHFAQADDFAVGDDPGEGGILGAKGVFIACDRDVARDIAEGSDAGGQRQLQTLVEGGAGDGFQLVGGWAVGH